MNSNIEDQIKSKIKNNKKGLITGDLLQDVLVTMLERDVFLTEDEYDALVAAGEVDEDKIYHIYE